MPACSERAVGLCRCSATALSYRCLSWLYAHEAVLADVARLVPDQPLRTSQDDVLAVCTPTIRSQAKAPLLGKVSYMQKALS